MDFTIHELKELKHALNDLIANRHVYLHAIKNNARETKFTEDMIEKDQELLSKVLKMINEVKENK